jgi:hypothetical protein
MRHRPQTSIAAPGATAEEAAAVVAAIEQFLRDRTPVVTAPPRPSAWLQSSLREGVARQPGLPPHWA